MRNLYKQQVVQFDNLDELKEFVRDLGNAQFYDGWEGEYIPVRLDAEDENLVLGSDAWETIEERHLSDIFGYIKLAEI